MDPANQDAFFRKMGEEEDRLRSRFYAFSALVGLPPLLWRLVLSQNPDAFLFGIAFYSIIFFLVPRILFHTVGHLWIARRQARLCRENGVEFQDLQEAIAPRRDALGLSDEKLITPSKALWLTLLAVALFFLLLLLAAVVRKGVN